MKKKIFAVILSLVMASVIFTGCNKSAGTSDEATSIPGKADEAKGTITIACTGSYAPYAYQDKKGNAAGYDVAVMSEVAKRLGYEVNWVTTQWDSLLVGLDSGKFDVAVNQLYTNNDRKKLYNMGNVPYNESVQKLVVAADSNIVTLDDLKGGTIATSVGSAEALLLENYLKKHKGAYKIAYLEDSANSTQQIVNGRVQATLNDPVNQGQQIKENNLQDKLKIVGDPLEINYVYAAFQKNDEGAALRDKFDKTILELVKDGTLKKLSLELLGDDYASKVPDGVIK